MADNGFYADGCNVLLCYIIVRSRGGLNWISNLIKHPTLATQATSQAIRVWRVKYGWRAAGRFSRKLIRVLVIISHDPMSVVTRHTSHNQRGSRYPGSQEITMVSGHPDNTTDRPLVWCLSGHATNDKLRITRMRGSTAPTHSVTSEHWAAWLGLTMGVFNKQERIVRRLRADILGQLNPFIQPGPVHISWYFTRLEN